ncbi:hypothetical protein D3C71_1198620 [compost metagenome]
MHQFHHQQRLAKSPVADQFDIASNLLHSMLVIPCEVTGDTKQARCRPVDRVRDILTQPLHHQPLKLLAVIKQPIEIEQSLIDDVLIHRALVFNDDRRIVLIDAQRIDPPAMHGTGRMFASQKAHTKQSLKICLEHKLERPFDLHSGARQLGDSVSFELK